MALGLTLMEYVAIVAGVEFAAAVGVASLVVYYRDIGDDDQGDGEWRFDP